jgi:hypothetical protein
VHGYLNDTYTSSTRGSWMRVCRDTKQSPSNPSPSRGVLVYGCHDTRGEGVKDVCFFSQSLSVLTLKVQQLNKTMFNKVYQTIIKTTPSVFLVTSVTFQIYLSSEAPSSSFLSSTSSASSSTILTRLSVSRLSRPSVLLFLPRKPHSIGHFFVTPDVVGPLEGLDINLSGNCDLHNHTFSIIVGII